MEGEEAIGKEVDVGLAREDLSSLVSICFNLFDEMM